MRLSAAVTFVALLLLPSCGGGAPEFADAVSALEAGDQARAAKNAVRAEAAYRYAIDNAGAATDVKYKALLALGELQASKVGRTKSPEDFKAAIATFARVETECAADYDFYGAQRIIDAWIGRAHDVSLADKAVKAAEARFPDQADKLARQKEGVAALEKGDVDALKGIGYVGE